MAANLILAVTNRFPGARRWVFAWVFDRLAAMTQDVESWTFMNYGYADPDELALLPDLEARHEPERYCTQLYAHATRCVELRGRDVVEVSCGRGGGAAYLARCRLPGKVVGVDLSAKQIEFCHRVHRLDTLTFLQGDAESLPLADDCADVVVNIEASCVYENRGKFFSEVRRILRPNGRFVYADFFQASEVEGVTKQLGDAGLAILSLEDITANVAYALKVDHQRRIAALQLHAPLGLRRLLMAFSGTQGTIVPQSLASGRLVYLSMLLAPS